MLLDGKVIVVTGGAGGIGFAISKLAYENGAKICIADVREAKFDFDKDRFLFEKADITKIEDNTRVLEKTLEKFGDVDGLVNSVGWDYMSPFLSLDPALWQKIININYVTILSSCYVFGKYMNEKKKGSIVNISSDAGRVGSTGESVYSGTKGAIIAFSKTLAREFARNNVRVNVVCPGPTRTGLLDELESQEFGKKIFSAMANMIPLKRIAEPEDIAPAVIFLLTDGANYITGQTLSVSGGLTMV